MTKLSRNALIGVVVLAYASYYARGPAVVVPPSGRSGTSSRSSCSVFSRSPSSRARAILLGPVEFDRERLQLAVRARVRRTRDRDPTQRPPQHRRDARARRPSRVSRHQRALVGGVAGGVLTDRPRDGSTDRAVVRGSGDICQLLEASLSVNRYRERSETPVSGGRHRPIGGANRDRSTERICRRRASHDDT